MQQRNKMKGKDFGKSIVLTERSDTKSISIYFKELCRLGDVMSPEQETLLFEKYHETHDENILNSLVEKNLRFVVSVAKPYANASKLPLEDVISYGNIGLLNAAHEFDYTLGFRFVSFAVNHIRKSIIEGLSEMGTTVVIPINKRHMLSRIKREVAKFEQQECRQPTIEEIAEIMNTTVDDVMTCYSLADFVSMDASVSVDTESYTIGDTISNDCSIAPESSIDKNLIKSTMIGLLSKLPWKEEYIMRRLFGLGAPKAKTEYEIADEMHMTKERVRQLKMCAMEKIKTNPNASELAEYLSIV